jgi:hypothetical protein
MKSHGWKPVVYVTTTLAAVAVVLALAFLVARLVHPGFTLVGMHRSEGKLTLVIAGLMAYGTVMAVNQLLKRFYGREFGTYLDDPDEVGPGQRPPLEKICTRCGERFGAFRNDFHAAGFCSRACQEAFARRNAR